MPRPLAIRFQSAQAATPLGNILTVPGFASAVCFNPPKRRRRLGTGRTDPKISTVAFQSAQAATPLGNAKINASFPMRMCFNPPKRRRRLGTTEIVGKTAGADVSIRPSGDAAWEPAGSGTDAAVDPFQSAQAATPLGNDAEKRCVGGGTVSIRPSGDAAWERRLGQIIKFRPRFNPPKRRRRLGTTARITTPTPSRFQSAQAATPLGNQGGSEKAMARIAFQSAQAATPLGNVAGVWTDLSDLVSIRPSGDAAWEHRAGMHATRCRPFQSAQAATPLGNRSAGGWRASRSGFNPPKRRRRLGTRSGPCRPGCREFQSAQAATPLGNRAKSSSAKCSCRFNPPKRRRRLGTRHRQQQNDVLVVSIRPSGDAAWEHVCPRRVAVVHRVSIRPSGDAAWEPWRSNYTG